MANPNIDLLGAVYPTVAGVTLPTQGGGTATFPWVEGSQTITQNGTVDVTSLASVIVNVSGGGGASNIVTGTFKGTTTGAAMDVTLNYTGNGYPLAFIIYPNEGAYNSNGTFYGLIQRYAYVIYAGIKYDSTTAPSYSGSGAENGFMILNRYKSSTSSGTTYQQGGSQASKVANDENATNSSGLYVRIRSKTKMSVYIAGTSYGFAANYDYRYWVLYSS